MASSGFRPPQFSEDIAWLPAWLQPHQIPPFDEHSEGTQNPQKACNDLVFLQLNTSEGKDANLFPREDARYNSCHLFLSGDDNTPVGITPSSENLLHFHLHLSSNGISQHTPSSVPDIFQTERCETDNNPSMQLLPETSAGLEDRACQNKIHDRAGTVNLMPIISKSRMPQTSRLQSLTNDNINSGRKHREKFDARHLKNADTKAAVELSIAASEALAISELVKSGSPSEVLPAETVLEVALRVKEARNHLCLDELDDASACTMDEVDETDLLLNLDDNYMADALEDVGLVSDNLPGCSSVIKQACNSSRVVSRVLDTPISENHYACDGEVQNIELRDQEVDFDGISRQKKFEDTTAVDLRLSKNSPLESTSDAWEKKFCYDTPLNPSSDRILLKPHLQWSIQTTTNCLVTSQEENLDIGDITLFDTHARIDSSRFQDLKKPENEEIDVAPGKFRSRWFGGWTGKDDDVSANLERFNTTSIPKFFNGETSFLSESADVVPDENSYVQKLEAVPCIASFSSIPFESICSKATEGIILSQDLVRSSSLSLADPLCSVVPCSISSDNADVTLAPDQKAREVEAEEFLNPTSEFVLENLHITPEPIVEFANRVGHVLSKVNAQDSRDTSRRQLTSLKTYSMLVPAQNIDFENGNVYGNEAFSLAGNFGCPSSEKNVNYFNYSNNESTRPLVSKTTSKRSAGEDNEVSANEKQITKSTDQKEDGNKFANDRPDLQVHQQEERCSPLILNYRSRRRLQAIKIVVSNDIEEENSRKISIPELTKTKNAICSGDQSKITSSLFPHPLEDQCAVGKRVRFSEAEFKFQGSKSSQMLRTGKRTRLVTRTGKTLKDSCPQLHFKTREVDNCLTSSHLKCGKKMIFQGLEFFLTGFSSQKQRELEMLVRKNGGVVLSDVPLSSQNLRRNRRSKSKKQQIPVVLSPKKLQTTKFLYGCAVNAFLLKAKWLTDSIVAGSILQPEKYMILSNQANVNGKRVGQPVHCYNVTYIFDKVGIMLHGKHSFCTKLTKIIKHGGGQVFKTLQWLVQSLKNGKISVGAIVAEDKSRASRHLRHCALEQKLPMMPASWIINSLHLGKLLPFTENNHSSPLPTIKILDYPIAMELSEEI